MSSFAHRLFASFYLAASMALEVQAVLYSQIAGGMPLMLLGLVSCCFGFFHINLMCERAEIERLRHEKQQLRNEIDNHMARFDSRPPLA